LPGGCISADQIPKIGEVAKRYGRGVVRLTARQGLEIPWIEFKRIEAARRELAEAGISLGACGPRFRAVTTCPGSPVCRRGIVDAQKVSLQIDQRFGGKLLPSKFKASVSGCPNACSKPREDEIGLCGVVQPKLDLDVCTGCSLCAEICKEKALSFQDGKPVSDMSRCVRCGDCIQICPIDAWKADGIGYVVFAGGKMGRHPRLGEMIADFVDEEQVLGIIQSCLDFYLRHGNRRERFSDLVQRYGVERFKAEVLSARGI
jgi:dissimilatory sulfite reductase (desulfoviridin) alpha/beta subunit